LKCARNGYIPLIGNLYNVLELCLARTKLGQGICVRSVDSRLEMVISDAVKVLPNVEFVLFSNWLHLVRKQDIKVLARKKTIKKT
jgi:hypothetical protein